MQILYKTTIRCQVIVPYWPSVKAKSQVWGHLILKMQHSTTRQTKHKICANLEHHWSIKCSFLCVQTNWVCPSGTQRYCKNDCDSSRVNLWKTWLESSRVTIFLTWLESSPSHHKSWLDSRRVIDSSHAITVGNHNVYATSHSTCYCLILHIFLAASSSFLQGVLFVHQFCTTHFSHDSFLSLPQKWVDFS